LAALLEKSVLSLVFGVGSLWFGCFPALGVCCSRAFASKDTLNAGYHKVCERFFDWFFNWVLSARGPQPELVFRR